MSGWRGGGQWEDMAMRTAARMRLSIDEGSKETRGSGERRDGGGAIVEVSW